MLPKPLYINNLYATRTDNRLVGCHGIDIHGLLWFSQPAGVDAWITTKTDDRLYSWTTNCNRSMVSIWVFHGCTWCCSYIYICVSRFGSIARFFPLCWHHFFFSYFACKLQLISFFSFEGADFRQNKHNSGATAKKNNEIKAETPQTNTRKKIRAEQPQNSK